MNNEDLFKRLSRNFSRFLKESSEYDEEKHSNFIKYSMWSFISDK